MPTIILVCSGRVGIAYAQMGRPQRRCSCLASRALEGLGKPGVRIDLAHLGNGQQRDSALSYLSPQQLEEKHPRR